MSSLKNLIKLFYGSTFNTDSVDDLDYSGGSLPMSLGVGADDLIHVGTLTDTSPSAPSTTAVGTGGSAGPGGTYAAGVLSGLAKYENLVWVADTVAGATGGVLNIYIQTSPDGGTTWYDHVALPQLGIAAAAACYRTHGALTGAMSLIGKNLTPALAAGTIAGGFWGDKCRVVYVSGSGTSAGATQTIKCFGWRAKA